MDFSNVHPFIVSILIGLLIGIERERSHPKLNQPLGVRTFVLLSLLGTLSAWTENFLIIAATLSLASIAIIAGYIRSTYKRPHDMGLTTEIAGIVVFFIGNILFKDIVLGSILGILTLFILFSRERLHKFSRETLKPSEIQAIITLLMLSVVIIPLSPSHPIDKWGLIVPQKILLLITIIAIIQFIGYVAMRMMGPRAGILISGFLGGFVSSTAVFINLAHLHKKDSALYKSIIGAGLLASTSMLIELLILVFGASMDLFVHIAPYVLAMTFTCAILGLVVGLKQSSNYQNHMVTSPLDLLNVLKISLIIIVSILILSVSKIFISKDAAVILAFLGGFFELHGISLATALMHASGELSEKDSVVVMGAALLAALISKVIIMLAFKHSKLAFQFAFYLVLVFSSGVLTYLILKT